MSTGTKKSFKAALALGGGLFTVGLMAAMMEGEDGPPAEVVDGVQSTMNSIVDKAGGGGRGGGGRRRRGPQVVARGRAEHDAEAEGGEEEGQEDGEEEDGVQGGEEGAETSGEGGEAAPVTPPKAPAREKPAAEDAPPALEADEDAPPAVADATAAVPDFAVGARVEAKWAEEWFCAVVEEAHADRSYEVE